MDSEGTFPYDPSDHCYATGFCDTLGGAGVAPDNWWFLGGPDYGSFAASGAVWSTRTTPGGSKSILLDVEDPLVQQSGGVTQVIAVNQTSIRPIRISGYVAGEGLNGHPRINLSFMGYPPGFPGVGGGDLTFYSSASGDYDFVKKTITFIPSRPVKYLFLHLLHRGFSAGKAWYGEFSVEEIDMPQVTLPEGNCTINPNFFYTPDETAPTGWDTVDAVICDTASPIGTTSLEIELVGSVIQKDICVDTGVLKQKVTVYAKSAGLSTMMVVVKLLDRYRGTISEKTTYIQLDTTWKTTDLFLVNTSLTEKADIEIYNTSGDTVILGGILLVSQEFTPSKMTNITPTTTTASVTAPTQDSTVVVTLDAPTNPNHIEVDPGDFNGIMYVTDGILDSFAPSAVNNLIDAYKRSTMSAISGTEFTISPWVSDIEYIEDDGTAVEQLLRIPHAGHPDNWLITTGGTIPASDTRYYCVTALNGNGETNQSNEVRAITGSATNTNRVPIEITPVVGATKYRVYMTQHEDLEQPWQYSIASVKKVIWDDGNNHLVTEVTATELRDAGYIVYDTGAALSVGFPPTTNTATRWAIDDDNEKVVFDAASAPAGTVTAIHKVSEVIGSILYLPDSSEYMEVGIAGIYEQEADYPGILILSLTEANIVSLSYYDEPWYMTTNGDVKNLTATTYPSAAGFTAFCFVNADRIARITAAGTVKIYDLSGNVVSEFALDLPGSVSCSGLALYFGNLITLETNTNKLIIFNTTGTILQSEGMPIVGATAWNIIGTSLIALTTFTLVVYRILAQNYYAKLDKQYLLGGNPQHPTLTRPLLPGEVSDPVYPELLPNGTFTDGSTFPSGFEPYGPPEIESGFSDEVDVVGTRAIYFHFPYASWKSLNKYNLAIIGGRWYNFSVHCKATAESSIGLIGIVFRDSNDIGAETFYSFTYPLTYGIHETIVQAPIDAVTVDFRIFAYGSDAQGITYWLNVISIKEQAQSEETFEHVYNGNFSIYPTGAIIPSGWSIVGEYPSRFTTVIEDPTMQSEGKALKITAPTFEEAGWYALESQEFDVEEGDKLQVSFYFRKGTVDYFGLQVSIYYTGGPAAHTTVGISTPTTANPVVAILSANPAGYTKAKLRIWPGFDDLNWIEMISVTPVVSLNKVTNSDFTSLFTGWSRYGYNMQDETVTNLGTSLDLDNNHSARYSCKFTVDRIACRYAELRQTITLNQTTPKKVSFSAWAKSESINNGDLYYELWVKFTDDTSEYIYDKYWPRGAFSWTELAYDYTPTKNIEEIDVILDFGRGGTCVAWVDDIVVTEEQDVPTVDDIVLTVPYTELSTNTVTQIDITAQVMNNGSAVEQEGLDIVFTATPNVGSFISMGTNALGKARAIYTLPESSCEVTIQTAYGALTDSAVVTVFPLVIQTNLEPTIVDMPTNLSSLNLEVIVPKTPKPLPDVTERIGRWEVFRSTVYNDRQMLDYDMHYGPDSDWTNVRPDRTATVYPKLLLFNYFDDLSAYPYLTEWQEIMAQRKEWFCLDATGFSAPFGDGRYYFNWRNMETTQWYVDRLIREQTGWSDGIYIDDFWGEAYATVADFEWSAEGSQLLNFRTVQERLQSSANRLRLLRDELHRQGKYLTTNFGCSRETNTSGQLTVETEVLAMPFDGFLLECWLYTWASNPVDITTESFTYEFVKTEIDFIVWCGNNNKWVVALSRSGTEFWGARMFCLAAFLMGKYSHAYYCQSAWGNNLYGSDWHELMQPECFIVTGQPSGVYQDDGGLFSRLFENCVALLNMSGTDQTYTLPAGTWYTMRGASYIGTITVTDRQGVVLVLNRP